MSRSVKQPVGQKRLTNVAVVRLKKSGKRFEIACYKNKVLSWRSAVEKDLDEVLQTRTVFANVSKGVLANSTDLVKSFGTDDEDQICLEILNKGEVQVADKERESKLTNQFRDIAMIVMDKTVNPETQRPYPISMIERLLREVHFAVDPHRSSKQQALEVIPMLQKKFSIARARMKLRLVVPLEQKQYLRDRLSTWGAHIESEENQSTSDIVVCELEPGRFREVDLVMKELNARLDVISVAVQKEGEGNFDEHDYESEGRALESLSLDEPATALLSRDELDAITGAHTHPETGWRSEAKEGAAAAQRATKVVQVEKQQRCKTCDADVGDTKQYREHFKTDWHKHNLKRRMKTLAPLSWEDCLIDTDIVETVNDLKDYSH